MEVVEAVLVVRCHNERHPFGGHVLKPDAVHALVEKPVVNESQITSEQLIYNVLLVCLRHIVVSFYVCKYRKKRRLRANL